LRKKINKAKVRWNYFATLTLSPQDDVLCRGYHIFPKQRVNKQTFSSYWPYQIVRRFESVPLGMLTNQIIRKTLNHVRIKLIRMGLPKLQLIWRFERGKKGGREHYHILFKSNICHILLYSILNECWNHGYVDLKVLTNEKSVKNYITKYLTKHTKKNNLRTLSYRRRWGFSMNIPYEVDDEKEKEWDYYGVLEHQSDAEEYFISTAKEFVRLKGIKFASFVYNDILKDNESINRIAINPYNMVLVKKLNIIRRNKIRNLVGFINNTIYSELMVQRIQKKSHIRERPRGQKAAIGMRNCYKENINAYSPMTGPEFQKLSLRVV
jgi:hypothetical protein